MIGWHKKALEFSGADSRPKRLDFAIHYGVNGTRIVSMLLAFASLAALAGPEEEFRDEIRPLLEKHCFDCHGEEKQKGDINLASFTEYAQINEARETWQ